jgi:hypothetical protein
LASFEIDDIRASWPGHGKTEKEKNEMIVEERDYRLHPGKLKTYLDLYAAEGMAVQKQILGNMLGYFSTDIGELQHVVHLWGYETYAERERRRAELGRNPVWLAYTEKMLPLVQTMTSRILIPTGFSPIG